MRDVEMFRRSVICIRISDRSVFGFHNRKDAESNWKFELQHSGKPHRTPRVDHTINPHSLETTRLFCENAA